MAKSKKRQDREIHLTYIAHMIKADKKEDSRQVEFFYFLAGKFNIGPVTAKRILDKPDDIQLKSPAFFDQRQQVLMDILMVMVIDKEIDEKELVLCRKFAEFLGFNSETAERVADGLLKFSEGKIGKKEIDRIIRSL